MTLSTNPPSKQPDQLMSKHHASKAYGKRKGSQNFHGSQHLQSSNSVSQVHSQVTQPAVDCTEGHANTKFLFWIALCNFKKIKLLLWSVLLILVRSVFCVYKIASTRDSETLQTHSSLQAQEQLNRQVVQFYKKSLVLSQMFKSGGWKVFENQQAENKMVNFQRVTL